MMRYFLLGFCSVVALMLMTFGCTATYTLKIHRGHGIVEHVYAERDRNYDVHTVCKVEDETVFQRILTCEERVLN